MKLTHSGVGTVGRLGNALFELASTIGIAAKHGYTPVFPEAWLHRPYFNLGPEWFGDCSGLQESWMMPDCWHIDERARIYMQDIALFSNVMPQIRGLLQPSKLARQIMADHDEQFRKLPKPILGVHVRRGDNVPGQDPGTPDKHNYHPCPPLSYYEAAIAKLKDGMASIAVFSDEPEWAAGNISADYVHYGTPRPKENQPEFLTDIVLDFVDFNLFSSCKNHVCSNSTFGIFAALLSDWNESDMPIVPRPIFGPKLDYIDESLLFPSTWERMEYRNVQNS